MNNLECNFHELNLIVAQVERVYSFCELSVSQSHLTGVVQAAREQKHTPSGPGGLPFVVVTQEARHARTSRAATEAAQESNQPGALA